MTKMNNSDSVAVAAGLDNMPWPDDHVNGAWVGVPAMPGTGGALLAPDRVLRHRGSRRG